MKTISLLCIASLLLSTAAAQIPSSVTHNKPEVQPPIILPNITVPTTAADLAAGYASAIPHMSLKGLVIFVQSDGKIVPIKGIRSARAMGGVLLITFSAGDMMAINAELVVMITDGTRIP